jgi:uncharacterized protein
MEGVAAARGRHCGLMRQTRQAARARRGAMTLDQLDDWLRTLAPPSRVDGMSMLDGYLTAIIIGPCSIPPEEWFVDLLGERGRIATAAGKTLVAITAIAARFNTISEGLSIAPQKHAPIFERTDDGMVLPQPWCMGFLTGMRLRQQKWNPLLDLSRTDHGLMLPILLYCTDPLGRPMLGPPRQAPETEEFLRTAYHDIAVVILAIRDYWMPGNCRQKSILNSAARSHPLHSTRATTQSILPLVST